ncbi:MAG: hypothetical protein A2Z35_04945 [Actinobacteria bacterium RBG_19FT_COMBO_36_27]|nr:MAG: hypothetical protein A2Z35_04945 [Actinobacteria bacterium RBG_19FT_COMBO_36_27]
MNIFKRFKKRIEEKNKFKRLEELFDEIATLFPKRYVALTVHDIDLTVLDKRIWKIGLDNTAQRINRKDEYFDIILFGNGSQ